MNKHQIELLEKAKETNYDKEIPLLEHIYIIPQTKRHESGYKMMYVIGYSKQTNEHYLLDKISDVVDIGELYHTGEIHIDILHNGIIHLWSDKKFKSNYRHSSCTFELI